jgi:hypothetical protein
MMCKGIYNIWFVNTVISKNLFFNKKPLPYRQRGNRNLLEGIIQLYNNAKIYVFLVTTK